jgi:RNA ligase (TIGR02306 family)
MDNYKVPYTTIKEINPHGNADKLEIAMIYGFQVIVKKDQFRPNDKIFYIPIDSILPADLETSIFPEDSKVKLSKSRVRQIKLRGRISQGMVLSEYDIKQLLRIRGLNADIEFKLEEDYSALLNISKYEPPQAEFHGTSQPKAKDKNGKNPFFHKYNGVTNIKWAPDLFKNQEVIIQCKIHGSHVRFGKPPFVANTLLKKIKKFFGLTPKYEFVYGSNNVELTNKIRKNSYYGEDVYAKVLQKYSAKEKIKDGEFVHSEIYGSGIQKNYTYGCKEGEHKLVIFDVRIMQEDGTQKWLDPEESEAYAKERGFDFVPVLYTGVYNEQLSYELTKGSSVLCPEQKIREGIVIKKRIGYDNEQNKMALKWISEDYLSDDTNTDFH